MLQVNSLELLESVDAACPLLSKGGAHAQL